MSLVTEPFRGHSRTPFLGCRGDLNIEVVCLGVLTSSVPVLSNPVGLGSITCAWP